MRHGRKLRYIGVVAAAAMLSACASPAIPPKPDADLVLATKGGFERAQRAQFDCVYSFTEKYAKSPAFLPQDIATAVAADCRSQSLAELEAFRRYTIASHPSWAESTIQNSTTYYARGRDAAIRQEIVALVLRLRSGA